MFFVVDSSKVEIDDDNGEKHHCYWFNYFHLNLVKVLCQKGNVHIATQIPIPSKLEKALTPNIS